MNWTGYTDGISAVYLREDNKVLLFEIANKDYTTAWVMTDIETLQSIIFPTLHDAIIASREIK